MLPMNIIAIRDCVFEAHEGNGIEIIARNAVKHAGCTHPESALKVVSLTDGRYKCDICNYHMSRQWIIDRTPKA